MNRFRMPLIITFSLFVLAQGSFADETADLKNQIKTLQQRVEELEKQIGNQAQMNTGAGGQPSQYTYDPWDPLVQMQMIERRMGQMLKDNMADFNPKQDVKQTPDAYIISMDLPGMEKDKINIEVKNGMLVVSGDRTSEVKEDKPNKYYRQERSFGHFYQTIALPEDVKSDSIDAQYNNGVLTVKVPRTKGTNAAPGGQKIKVK